MTLSNKLIVCGKNLLVSTPTIKPENNPLSALSHCLISIFHIPPTLRVISATAPYFIFSSAKSCCYTYVQHFQKPAFVRLISKLNLMLLVQATYKWRDENYGLSKARRNTWGCSTVYLTWRCLCYQVGQTSRKHFVTLKKYTLVSGQLYLEWVNFVWNFIYPNI